MWSSGRRLARGRLYSALEALWGSGFALAGRFRPEHPAPWTTPGDQRIGIIAPHPDDETIGCGGVAVRHRAGGDTVAALIVTDGRAARAGGRTGTSQAAQRAVEAQAAARVLGLRALDLAGLPEGTWAFAAGVAAIHAWLAAQRPHLLYAPSGVDYHPEHLRVARAVAAALDLLPADQQPIVRVYEVFVPLGPGLINCVAALGPARATKAAALACYASQAAGLAQVPRRDRYLARFYGLPGAAEGFCTRTTIQYRALIAASYWTGRPSPYRGVRGRPFTDPLAYLVGRRERARLRPDDGP